MVKNAKPNALQALKTQAGRAARKIPIRGRLRRRLAKKIINYSTHSATQDAKDLPSAWGRSAGGLALRIRLLAWVCSASIKERPAPVTLSRCTRRYRK